MTAPPVLYWTARLYLLLRKNVSQGKSTIQPSVLKPLQKAWMTLAVILGWIMTRVILSILFYLVFTAIGGISRLLGKQFLDLKIDPSINSYWIKREPKTFNKSGYEKQF